MQSELKLPPSGRDFQVYQRVIVEGATTRQAASEFSLSQSRVRQLVQRVSEWIARELPAASEEKEATQLWLAKHIAADRLEHWYRDAMRGWRSSHETKYFGMAIRIITAQCKLPALPGMLDALAADALEGPLPEEKSPREEASQVVAPPIGDCSRPAADKGRVALTTSQPAAATRSDDPACAEIPEEIQLARRAFFGPAQTSAAADKDQPVTELEIAPQKPGIRVERPLSRRERRRLARLSA